MSRRIINIIGLLLCLFCAKLSVIAQSPVQWQFTSKNIAGNKFEIQITATIQDGWHVFASKQPPSAIAVPTSIRFTKNPLVQFKGAIKEIGKLEKIKEEELEIESWQYATQVSFVQTIELKTKAITNVAGNIQFQVCNNKQCLPAKTIRFDLKLSPQNL